MTMYSGDCIICEVFLQIFFGYRRIGHWGYVFDSRCVMFKYIVVIAFIGISSAIVFRWKAQSPTVDKSILG